MYRPGDLCKARLWADVGVNQKAKVFGKTFAFCLYMELYRLEELGQGRGYERFRAVKSREREAAQGFQGIDRDKHHRAYLHQVEHGGRR